MSPRQTVIFSWLVNQFTIFKRVIKVVHQISKMAISGLEPKRIGSTEVPMPLET